MADSRRPVADSGPSQAWTHVLAGALVHARPPWVADPSSIDLGIDHKSPSVHALPRAPEVVSRQSTGA